MDAKLLAFTQQALTQGIARPEIEKALRQAGWPDAEIQTALAAFADVPFALPVPRPKPYLSAREVFTYLIFFSALYVSAFNLGDMAFTFIDIAFPDPLSDTGYAAYARQSLRWNLASLVVSFPVFLFTFRLTTAAVEKDPTKRGSKPRKWLTYLTLFIAAVTLSGDVVVLVYNVLGGEFATRFLLKVATVAILAGGIFAYFLADMRREETER
jgi:hypothetical protein